MSSILLVDDNHALLMIQREILRRAGHEVVAASDAEQALALATAQDFDLVVTDLVMPGKPGTELIAELRRLRPAAKIIAISGGIRVGPHDQFAQARENGAASTLEKPYRDADLLRAVAEVLGPAR